MQGASLVFCDHIQWWDGKVHGRFKKDGIHTHTHTHTHTLTHTHTHS